MSLMSSRHENVKLFCMLYPDLNTSSLLTALSMLLGSSPAHHLYLLVVTDAMKWDGSLNHVPRRVQPLTWLQHNECVQC